MLIRGRAHAYKPIESIFFLLALMRFMSVRITLIDVLISIATVQTSAWQRVRFHIFTDHNRIPIIGLTLLNLCIFA